MIEAYVTLCMVLLPGLLLVLLCGAIQWLADRLDRRDRLLRWYTGDTLGNARTVRAAKEQRRRAG